MDIDPKTQGAVIALIIGYWAFSCGKLPQWTKVQLQ